MLQDNSQHDLVMLRSQLKPKVQAAHLQHRSGVLCV